MLKSPAKSNATQPAVGVARRARAASSPDGAWCSTASTRAARRRGAPAGRASRRRPRAAAAPRGRACRRSRRRSPTARCAPARGAIASTLRDLVAVHVGRLRAGEDADPAQRRAAAPRLDDLGVARLGLDVGVLDVARLEGRARRRSRRGGERRIDVAADDAAAAEHVVGIARVQRRAGVGRGERGGARSRRGERGVQRIGTSASAIARERRRVADEREHRLAAEAHDRRRRARAGRAGRGRSRTRCSARRRR